MDLLIKKGGVIERKSHGRGTEDVTYTSAFHLMEPCTIEDGVTLGDIFLILRRGMNIYKTVINNWVEEIVEEGLSGKTEDTVENDSKIEFLELYWDFTSEIGEEPGFSGFLFPSFHGWGEWSKCEFGHYPDGHKGGIGISLSPAYTLIDIPVKLRDSVSLSTQKNYRQSGEVQEFKNPSYSLLHILYGIIWELSFMGSPDNRDKESQNLKDIVQGIKDGTEKLIPFEDVFPHKNDGVYKNDDES